MTEGEQSLRAIAGGPTWNVPSLALRLRPQGDQARGR